jgi:hypothetical protein
VNVLVGKGGGVKVAVLGMDVFVEVGGIGVLLGAWGGTLVVGTVVREGVI